MSVDPAFRNITKSTTCFAIWRVERMQLVPVPRDHYGNFFNGDSYLILNLVESGDSGGVQIKVKDVKRPLDIHIHFWLGEATSQDEAGVAAYKCVELDDFLGGSPVQHREVQGHESARFLSYFKQKIRYLHGGVASGFNHVTDEFEPRMFLVKGKRRPIVRQMATISWDVMNDGDVFVIDAREAIFVWTGRHANYMEKLQGAQVAQEMKDDHGTGTIIIVEDGQESTMTKAERDFFDQFLPIKSKEVKSCKDAQNDETVELKQSVGIKLYQCTDDGGTLRVTEVKSGPLSQNDLTSQDSYIVDNGESGIWVWVGKKASQQERTEAMRNAQGFIKKKGLPSHTPVTRVIDGGEPHEFKTLFRTWKNKEQTVGLGRRNSPGSIAKTVHTKFDAASLHENPQLAAQAQMVDDGNGEKEVWRVENFDLVAVESSDHGKFFSGDCYVILYTYQTEAGSKQIIYYWLGQHSSIDERGTAALKTVELDNKNDGRPVQVRVVQGREPPHFLAIFGGHMIIYNGGVDSGFSHIEPNGNSTGSRMTNTRTEAYMLHVRGTTKHNTKATQVPMRASSLNSNDVFVVFSGGDDVYIWAGKGSTGDEREMARHVASAKTKDPQLMYESQEKEEFWEILGGKTEYANDKRLQEETAHHSPRLFQCSNASGSFKIDELVDFEQADLVEEDVMILDIWDAVFLWVGAKSTNEERKMADKVAMEYLRSDPSERSESTPVIKIKQGFEPPNFTGFFGAWDPDFWINKPSYDDVKNGLALERESFNPMTLKSNGTLVYADLPKYPKDALTVMELSELPEDVNPALKELHLNEFDFNEIFGMNLSAFSALPQWKQISLKKKAGLF